MLKLKNVSKFYYSKGVVASGFSKINLDLNMGEFVVITGESGSGKSTLLNVISGLDTYEEGEMYINGEETSHYNESDFETYRRKYIGNIFQYFNLVNSYTVYQNVELVLLINGSKHKDVKEKVLDIIRQVDLYRYRNTKVSKLSGGQKQRVAIARALAKETPIIVADEPTGNLDSRAAESVMRTLYEISKDKLVVVVTHNYDQVEKYATRKIRMHDGKVIEDKELKKTSKEVEPKLVQYKEMRGLTKLRLGIRNTFNIVPKFLLLLLLYCFITLAVTAEYSSIQKKDDENLKIGYNQFFRNNDQNRIVIKKKDKTPFNDEDYKNIEKLDNIKSVVKNDLLLDTDIILSYKDFSFYGNSIDIKNLEGPLDVGRMPANDMEVVIEGSEADYYLNQKIDELLDKEYTVQSDYSNTEVLNYKLKIVGVKYMTDLTSSFLGTTRFYVSEKVLTGLQTVNNQKYSSVETKLNSKMYKSDPYMSLYRVVSNKKVPKGQVYISSDMNYNCGDYNCKNKKLTIYAENIYYKENRTLKITKTYTKDNYKKLTGLKNYDENNGEFYINPNDYNTLFTADNYQSTIFIDSNFGLDKAINDLNEIGYDTLSLKKTLVNPIDTVYQFIQIFRVVLIVILTVGLFFVSYFIIKLILKSRNIYFSTIRILGASRKTAKRLLDIELFTVINLAYLIFLTLVILVRTETVKFDYIKNLSQYLKVIDYVIVYLFLVIMSWFISNRFARKLFKKSAMNTYREEV